VTVEQRAFSLSKLTRDSLAMGIGDTLTRLCIFIATIHLARSLGAAGFGHYTFSLSVFIYLNMISDLGLEWTGVRRIGQLKKHNPSAIGNFVANILGLRLLLLLGAYSAFGVCLFGLARLSDIPFWPLAPFGVALLFGAVLPDWILTGLEEFRLVALSRIIRWTCFVCLVMLLVRSPGDVIWASSCYTIAFGVCVLVLWTRCVPLLTSRTGGPAIDSTPWVKMLAQASSVFSYTLVHQAYFQLMTLMLGFVSTDVFVGLYSAASRVPLTMIGALSVFINVLFPTLVRLGTGDSIQPLLTLWAKGIVMVTGPFVALLAFMPRAITVSIFGAQYEAAIPMMIWLAPTIMIMPLVILFAAATTAAGREQRLLGAVVFGAGLMLASELSIGARWPVEGPAVSTVLASVAALVTLMSAFEVSALMRELLRPLAAIVVLAVLFYVLRQAVVAFLPMPGALLSTVAVATTGTTAYLLVLRVTGCFDFRTFTRLTMSRRCETS